MKLKQLLEQLKIKTHIRFSSFCEKKLFYNPASNADFLERISKVLKEDYKLIPSQLMMKNDYYITTKLSVKSFLNRIRQKND